MRSSLIAARRARHEHALVVRTLPDTIEVVVIAIRAGLSPADALAAAREASSPPVCAALDEVDHRLHRGQRFADAIGAFTDRLGPVAAPLVDELATADRYGLPLAPALDRLATAVRADRQRLAEEAARTLPVRLAFPLVVCTLPSFVLLAIAPALVGALSALRATAP